MGTAVFPLKARSFEKKPIFQEDQKTIFALIKLVFGIFFKLSPSIWVILTKYEMKFQKSIPLDLQTQK